MQRIDHLHIEAARTLDRTASVTSLAHADADNRMQAIADMQAHPNVRERAEAFNTQTVLPLLQEALGATFLASAQKVHSTLLQQMIPQEEKNTTIWDKLQDMFG